MAGCFVRSIRVLNPSKFRPLSGEQRFFSLARSNCPITHRHRLIWRNGLQLPETSSRNSHLHNNNGGIEVPSDRPHAPADARDPSAQAAERTDAFDKFAEIGNVATAPEPEICLGTDPLTGRDVSWPLTVKGNPHLLVTGLPGMGKTTCLLNVCQQMVAAGVRPIVFSYHEDIDQRLSGLVSSVRFLDFHGLGFNPLEVIDRQSRLGHLDVAGNLRDIFTAIFPELGDIQGESIRNAIKQSFVEKGWDAPNADLQQSQEPDFKRFVEILQSSPRPDRGLRTLLARLEELADYGFFDLAESQDSLWDSDQPIVIRIHKTQNDVLQKAFAALVFYKLYKDMFRRGIQTRITHAVIFDEAHRAARLTLIPTMAKECRKYGISLVLASQEARDFHISLFSTIANYLVLRLTEVDAKALVRNVASSDQERAWIDKIKQMDRFNALYFSERRKKPCSVARAPETESLPRFGSRRLVNTNKDGNGKDGNGDAICFDRVRKRDAICFDRGHGFLVSFPTIPTYT